MHGVPCGATWCAGLPGAQTCRAATVQQPDAALALLCAGGGKVWPGLACNAAAHWCCTLQANKADLGGGADVGGAEESALKAALHVADPAQELEPAASLLIQDLLQHLRLQWPCRRVPGAFKGETYLTTFDGCGGGCLCCPAQHILVAEQGTRVTPSGASRRAHAHSAHELRQTIDKTCCLRVIQDSKSRIADRCLWLLQNQKLRKLARMGAISRGSSF